jgi:large subunit ribosomal protein L29
MKKDKLSGLDPAEMRAKLTEMEDQNFQLRFRMSMGQTEGLRKIREMRKDRARLLTYLRAREIKSGELKSAGVQGAGVQGAGMQGAK